MDKESKMDEIRSKFSEKSKEYDARITKIIPRYDEMLSALVSCLAPPKDREFRVIDIGCGTGALSWKLLKSCPRVELTCLDMTENMLDIARQRLTDYRNVTYVLADLYDFEFEGPYDAVISSLALHHIVTDDEKKAIYQKIFDALAVGGSFYNADLVLGSDRDIQEHYMTRWKEFMYQSFSREEIDGVQIPRYLMEDSPARLIDHLRWLNEVGFNGVDVIWKYYNFVLYGGQKK